MRKLLLAASTLFFASTLIAQTDFSKVEVKATKVAGTVYMIQGAGGNIGVSVGEDGIVLVDDQFAPLAPKIREALKGISDKPIRFVLNTHYHGDHTGGNEIFGKDAPIIAQDNVRKRLASGTTGAGHTTPPAPAGALPVITFKQSVSVHLNGEDINAVYFPAGHTDGDAIIFFTKSNVVHMGDDFFNGNFPFIDIENGGSVGGMIANVQKIISSIPADAKVIPGHGPLGSVADLQKFLEMLRGTQAIVRKELAAGKTAEQMKKDDVLKDYGAWGSGFVTKDFFIDTLTKDLAGVRNTVTVPKY